MISNFLKIVIPKLFQQTFLMIKRLYFFLINKQIMKEFSNVDDMEESKTDSLSLADVEVAMKVTLTMNTINNIF